MLLVCFSLSFEMSVFVWCFQFVCVLFALFLFMCVVWHVCSCVFVVGCLLLVVCCWLFVVCCLLVVVCCDVSLRQ